MPSLDVALTAIIEQVQDAAKIIRKAIALRYMHSVMLSAL